MNRTQPGFCLMIVDDDPEMVSSISRVFHHEDYHIYTASNGPEALGILGKVRIDAALIDLKMPGMDGLTLLERIRGDCPQVMAVMLTGFGGIKEAVNALKLGAVDFLEKPFSPEGLRARVAQLRQIWELKEENLKLRDKIDHSFGYEHLVGNSTAILSLKQMIVQIGPTDESILIQGETGTGKELVARAIHHHSARSENNFVPVDCAAINEAVMESELYGHEKGAYTGAHVATLGLIRSADKGSLFLDEIGELPLPLQVKLLRTIQEKEVRPVGSNVIYPVDVRILAATNRDLELEVANGNFREDLLYRLNVITLKVPPLKERQTDIPLLAKYFIERFKSEFSPVKNISREATNHLESYDWPGNVRELENVIRRAIALGNGETILPEDIPQVTRISPIKLSEKLSPPSDDSLAAYERAAIENALDKSDHNRKKAARILGIGEATLYRKIKSYGIKG